MIDIKALREDPEVVGARLLSRGVTRQELDELLRIDDEFRTAVSERDETRARVNALSRSVGQAMRNRSSEEAERLRGESREIGVSLTRLEEAVGSLEVERMQRLLVIPNLPSLETPVGSGAEENQVLRYWHPQLGDVAPEDFELPAYEAHQEVPHWEIGIELGILDLQTAAKISGSMFPMYRGAGARIIRALTTHALNRHSDSFEEIKPPTLVRKETMISTGHLPKFAEDAYELERDGLYAIPTAEVPLTSMAKDSILQEGELPLRFTAATSCFRREAGSAGRDTRGLLRLHEFDKVELFAYCTKEQSKDVHADMLSRAEGLLRDLGLCYRVLDLCTGDLGGAAARTFDLEAYSPGTGRWLEVSSVSWCSDYQARRANIRYRDAGDGVTHFVHTLNGSALAWARIWAILMEVGRQADGSVDLPDCIVPYMGGLARVSKKSAT